MKIVLSILCIGMFAFSACSSSASSGGSGSSGSDCNDLSDTCGKCTDSTIKHACETSVSSGDCKDGLDDPDILSNCIDAKSTPENPAGACQRAAAVCDKCTSDGLKIACHRLVNGRQDIVCAHWLAQTKVKEMCR